MDDRLAGRTAVVFGGGTTDHGPRGVRSIGSTCAATFAAHGATVAVVDHDEAAAARTVEAITHAGGSAFVVRAEMVDEDAVVHAVEQIVARCGAIHVVLNDVGNPVVGGVEDLSLDQWHSALSINLDTVFLGARATLPHLVKTRGSLVNISSTASIRWTGFHYPAYAAAKAAVNQLTQSIALQYAATGVRVNAIVAGLIDTPLAYRELSEGHDVEAVRAARDAKSPTGSMGTAQDVANAALFLACDESSYITGALIPVDGGLHARAV